jgi:DNA-binding response OmpR family regulator
MKIVINNANPIFGNFLTSRLRRDGNEVCQVENDSEMVQMVNADDFDLIIFISIRLCISDTCPIRILARKGKVVVLSTVYDEKAVLEAYKMGIKMYMTLPVDPSVLIRKVRALV